jgi:aldehyde dehydrogenase (NAD+)
MTDVAVAPLLIDGAWTGDAQDARENPARPGVTVVRAARADHRDVEAAVAAATRASAAWRRTSPPARGAILSRAAELLAGRRDQVAAELCAEEGKTLREATGEVSRAVDILRYFGGEGWRLSGEALLGADGATQLLTRKEPIGVVAVITPWNFPIAIPAWKIAPALVSGNAVIFKPASLTPLSAHRLAECLVDAGLPPGVLGVLHGPGATVGDPLTADPRVAGVSFTGSTSVGLHINELVSARLGRVQLEMGGKNALVVLDDADPARAAAIAAQGSFSLTGQACTATSRIICGAGIHDRFVEALQAEALKWRAGDGADPQTTMGPVVSHGQFQSNVEFLDAARNDGASSSGGGPVSDLFFDPVVLVGVQPSSRVACEEIFGPIVAVFETSSLDDAIELANDSVYGLTAGVVTNDLAAAMRFADEADVGVVKVNQPTTGLELNVPFGGVKLSSTGTYREQGRSAVEFYTRIKTIYLGT